MNISPLQTVSRPLLFLSILLLIACNNDTSDSDSLRTSSSINGSSTIDSSNNDIAHEVGIDAEQFLVELRAKRWLAAAKLCLLDEYALRRFELSPTDDEEIVQDRIAALYQQVYENLPPGVVYGVDIDPLQKGDTTLARVVYLHGDLDAFHMRKVDNRWRYTFE